MQKLTHIPGGNGFGAMAISLVEGRNGGRAIGLCLANQFTIRLHLFAPDEIATNNAPDEIATNNRGG
jgi:hypothetical protein